MASPSPGEDPPPTCVLFDLDGTLTDSAPGILASVRATLRDLDVAAPADAELRACLGPPMSENLLRLLSGDPQRVQDALAVYRAHYRELGLPGCSVFPGIPELLAALRDARVQLAVATSKRELDARRVLDHFGLSGYFTSITGASEDEARSTKADVIAEALLRLGRRGVSLRSPMMVGDRRHDVEGAAANGVPAIWTSWGYGRADEARGSRAVADSPRGLGRLLGLSREPRSS